MIAASVKLNGAIQAIQLKMDKALMTRLGNQNHTNIALQERKKKRNRDMVYIFLKGPRTPALPESTTELVNLASIA